MAAKLSNRRFRRRPEASGRRYRSAGAILATVLAATAFTAVAPPAWAEDVSTPAPSSPAPEASGLTDALGALDALASLRHSRADAQPPATPEVTPPPAPVTTVGGANDEQPTDDAVPPSPEPTDPPGQPVVTPTPTATPTPTPTPAATSPAVSARTPAEVPIPAVPPAVPPRVPPAPTPPLTIHDAPGDYVTQDARNRAERARAEAEAAAARAEAAARASAARIAAFTAAQADVATATAAYNDAKLAYASVKSSYDAATERALLVHGMATDAADTAARAGRVVATITRAMAQQRSGTATVDAFLEGSGSNLLYRLGTLDKLSHLSGSLAAIKERSATEQKRADTLLAQDQSAQQAVLAIPLETARSDMETAKAGFDAATARLDSLRRTSTAGVLGMSPLPARRPDTGQLSAQGWVLPAVGSITDHFGPRPDKPLPDVGAYHYGTDIGASCDAGVYAATSGIVVSAGALGTYGNWILIDHGKGVQTGYAHLASGQTLVSVGDTVIAGQVIAGVGSTGASTGCHLHVEVRIDGTRVDPQPFFAKRGVVLGR